MLEHITSVAGRTAPTMYAQSSWINRVVAVVWELEAAEHAATYRDLTLDLLQYGAGDPPFGSLEWCVARMSTLLGNFDEAQDYFERARRTLDAAGRAHMRGMLDYDQATALFRARVSDDARIQGLLDAALDSFRAHGVLGWAARAARQRQAFAAHAGRVPV